MPSAVQERRWRSPAYSADLKEAGAIGKIDYSGSQDMLQYRRYPISFAMACGLCGGCEFATLLAGIEQQKCQLRERSSPVPVSKLGGGALFQ